MRQLQANPDGFAGIGAVGGVGHQLGAHLLRGDHGFDVILGRSPCRECTRSYKNNSNQKATEALHAVKS
jgi:hypothetical protein